MIPTTEELHQVNRDYTRMEREARDIETNDELLAFAEKWTPRHRSRFWSRSIAMQLCLAYSRITAGGR